MTGIVRPRRPDAPRISSRMPTAKSAEWFLRGKDENVESVRKALSDTGTEAAVFAKSNYGEGVLP